MRNILRLLVEAGADINQKDQYGNTILMWAAQTKKDYILEFLIEEMKANVTLKK